MKEEEALEVLGISKDDEINNLSPSLLRKRYLKAALASHPDKNPKDIDSSEKFASLQEAYNLLLQKISADQDAKIEQAKTEEIFNLFQRALQGENVESELQKLGVYRPSAMFGVDLSVPFDRRIPPPPNNQQSVEEEVRDIKQAFAEAFADEGLDEEGNPLEGWARPPQVDLEDL